MSANTTEVSMAVARLAKTQKVLEGLQRQLEVLVQYITRDLKVNYCSTYLGMIELIRPLSFRDEEGNVAEYHKLDLRTQTPAAKQGNMVFTSDRHTKRLTCPTHSMDFDPNRKPRSTLDEWQEIFEVVVESIAVTLKQKLAEIDPDEDRLQKLQNAKQRIIDILMQ